MDTRRALLDALESGPVSGPDLAEQLDVSRAAVWKHVEALRDRGFEIESGDDGYVVTDAPTYGAAAIRYGSDAPYGIEFHDAIGSTNDRARELAEAGRTDVAVIADEQTGGRGRLDRDWTAPSGGIYASVVIRPDLPPAHAPIVTLAAAVAATDACRDAGVDARIKWPNDVLVPETDADRDGNDRDGDDRPEDDRDDADEGDRDDRPEDDRDDRPEDDRDENARGGAKLAGILTEMRGEADRVSWIVVGIGVNANVDPAALPSGATSLRAAVGEDVDRRHVTQTLLERFHELTTDPDFVLAEWRDRAITIGRSVRVETASGTVEGTAVDVEFPGALVLETDDGTETVLAGDCEHLRPVE
ncbi:bifunctional biotin--[acetyl-CoA-carboxylase] synthetase/biotin operon repressor [haloarchaeon 3A1-DGR]|nr:bifunctional biotin--[acetyl-CoA-carboxylase] synthetase/biotin operon repressor [haloarchaeon 3A1-DGR]